MSVRIDLAHLVHLRRDPMHDRRGNNWTGIVVPGRQKYAALHVKRTVHQWPDAGRTTYRKSSDFGITQPCRPPPPSGWYKASRAPDWPAAWRIETACADCAIPMPTP